MRQREVERIARRMLPGSGAARIRRLGAGLAHDTYRVTRGGRDYSMRVASSPGSACVPDEAWLLRVSRLAAERGLAPPLVGGDAVGGIVIHEWIEGRVWSAAAVPRARYIERMAHTLRQVHAMTVPSRGRMINPKTWVRRYDAALRTVSRASRPAARRAADPVLAATARARLAELEPLPQPAGVICHSDLHRFNVLDHRQTQQNSRALVLLDWEYAHVSDPFWDLAGWSANNDLAQGASRRLLAAYLGRAPRAGESRRCAILCWLYDYVCLLWSGLYLASRRSPSARASSALESRAAMLHARLSEGRE